MEPVYCTKMRFLVRFLVCFSIYSTCKADEQFSKFSDMFSISFSPHVVKYYGSYFKNTDLWIVMEYCGAGSVSDIIRLRNKTVCGASEQ